MQPIDIAAVRTPGTPTISPDGGRVVVAVSQPDLDENEYATQLWVVATDGATPPRPFTFGTKDSAPVFSPDGRWLAFLRATDEGKPQVYVMPTDGGEPRQVTDHPLGAGVPVWSPDSRQIAYVARVPEPGRYGTDEKIKSEKEPPRRITTMQYREDGIGFLTDRRRHLFVVDAVEDDATPRQLTDGDVDDWDVAWHPSGGQLAFVSRRHDESELDLRSDVYCVAADGSDLHRVSTGSISGSRPVFSADGSAIYFHAEELGPTGREFMGSQTGLYVVGADGAGQRRLTDPERYNAGDGNPATVLTDRGVLFASENRGAVDLLLVPFDGGEPATLLDGRRQVLGYAAAGDVIVAAVGTPDSAGEIVVLRDGAEKTLTNFADGMPEIRPMEELTATAPDGYPVHGWLVRPDGEGPHPVLLMIHGGPFAQYGWKVFDEAQVYAGAGYAVVYGNPRGSSGYGAAHGRFIQGDVGDKSAADLLALLDHALESPDLDSDRVGVLGGSHGGFMTTWLVGHSDRFTAAISERAVNAIDSFTGASDIGWFFADELYGPDPARQREQSPLTYADRIDTPLLIIHSEHDWRCPLEQAQRLFVALKRRGAQTELLLFPAEGHELSRSGQPKHRVARFEAILDWWARYLR